MKSKATKLLHSILALLLCISMLAGSTFAWFTDEVRSGINTIAAGNLDVELYHTNAAVTDEKVTSATDLFLDVNGEEILWEPGVVSYENLRIANEGDLALVYQLAMATANENHILDPNGASYGLSQILKVGVVAGGITATERADVVASVDAANWTTLSAFVREGVLLPEGAGESQKTWGIVIWWEPGDDDNRWNLNNGKVLDEGTELRIDLGVKLIATQTEHESDSFGSDYDTSAKEGYFPEFVGGTATVPVTPNAESKTDSQVSMASGKVAATVPAGAQLVAGTTALTLSVTEMGATGSNVVLGENEQIRSLNVHVEGIAPENTAPITVTLTEVAPVGLNMGNYKLYHVENGTTNEMTLVASGDAFTAHNQFKYDPATGTITLYMATFSEVAMTAGEAKWEGGLDYSWYTEVIEENADATSFTIANADQLAAFGAIVGGMAKDTEGKFLITYADSDGDEHHNDSFCDKTVKLLSDIDLGDKESENNPDIIFYPIGYWNSDETYEKTGTAISSGFYAFEGTFDGNGNTISNFYQNTWEMKGDHDWYDATLQYFRDGMGLFGKVYGGTVKNLTVDSFSCDSEIGTTGCIAAYADSKAGKPAVFENITITNCNPRVYNIGNGGIVGCAGWYSRNESLGTEQFDNAVTFRNITVDQTNKISALWGSWGVSCAGILGQYYPNSSCGIKLDNCHVAAIIDVNNDVCSNYQYYWYRYAGMFIGTIRANTTDANGNTVADTTGVSATGCTYTMGNWNEYWYCEIVANSLASYTHDHQFSRLDKIAAISEISDDNGETWKKEGHFVIPAADNSGAECYHIFKNSEGKLYRHFHDVQDESNPDIYESFDLNGDGLLNDLKEDRQRYFIPFNQLLTGLDMGIKAHTEFDGIEFVENGTTKSVQKFNATGNNVIPENGEVTVGSLFEASGEGNISSPTVQVYVSPVGIGSNVRATYTANVSDWDQGTLTFYGTGAAKVVINDYYYCTSTTLPVYVLGGDYYIGATLTNGTNWYMTSDLGTTNTKRFQAEAVDGDFPNLIADGEANKIFSFVHQENNQFKIQTGDEYLAWTSGNDISRVSDIEAGQVVTITYDAENKALNAFFDDDGTIRYLARNNNADDKYFAWYQSTNMIALKPIPIQTCQHANRSEAVDTVTCTTAGYKDYIECLDCGCILGGTEVDALGHTYGDDAICDVCGFNNEASEQTYVFADYTAGEQYAEGEEHKLDDNITVTTTQCHFTNELRIYSSSTHNGYAIIKSTNGKTISQMSVNAGDKKDTLVFYGSNDEGATWTEIGTVATTTTNYLDYTVTFSAPYTWIKVDVQGSNQVRLKGMTVTFGDAACTHTNVVSDNNAVPAACETTGLTASQSCADCGKTVVEQEEVAALGHNYVDGTCSVCGSAESTSGQWVLVTDATELAEGKQIVIVAAGYDHALSTTQNGNNRGSAVVTKSDNTVTFGDDVQILTLETGTTNGTFAFNDGSGYLYAASSSSNYLRTQTALDANGSWAITVDASGIATIKAQGTNTRNWLRYNTNGSNPIFAAYASGQQDVQIYMYVG